MDDKLLSDEELDQVLAKASNPEPSAGFEQRMLSRVTRQQPAARALPEARQGKLWLIGLPLAASLLVGVWLGNTVMENNYFTISRNAMVSDNSDEASDTGFDDVAAFIEGSST